MGLLHQSYPGHTKLCSALLLGLDIFFGGWLIHHSSAIASVGPLLDVCLLGLLAALTLLFIKPGVGYALAAVSGMVGLYWFFRLEMGNFPALNSWIGFNLADVPDLLGSLEEMRLRVLFGAALITSTSVSVNALLPVFVRFRDKPVSERIWIPLVFASAVVAFWYLRSVSPYRIPIFANGVRPELAILHIQKAGLQFHETRMSIYRNGEYYYSHNDRRLLQYRFAVEGGSGVLPSKLLTEAENLAGSLPEEGQSGSPKPLRSWRAEGWYITTRRGRRVSAFTTENRKGAPQEVVELFRRLVAIPPVRKALPAEKDICFGFCYDPLAGLQMADLNDRCGFNNGTGCE